MVRRLTGQRTKRAKLWKRSPDHGDGFKHSHPTSRSFFVWGNDLQRALLRTERRAILCVGDDNFRVHEVTVQLSEGEDNAISVGCFCQDIGSHGCTAEAVTLRHSGPAQKLLEWNAFVNFILFLVRVEHFQSLSRHLLQISYRESEWNRKVAGDAQFDCRRIVLNRRTRLLAKN